MDYKSVVAETPHVVQYLRKSIQVPVAPKIGAKTAVDGKIKTEEKVVKCGVVVAIKENGKVSWGWSVCSDRDNFSNSKGKAIAILRAKSGKNHTDNVPTEMFSNVILTSEKMMKLAEEVL